MKFSEMPYQRVELEECREQADKLTRALGEADSYETAREAFRGWQELSSSINTNMSLAVARHTIDTADPFYDGENQHCDEIGPALQELDQEFTKAMLESPYREQFTGELGELYFKNAEIALRSFHPDMIPDMQEENRLSSAYAKLIASAQIEFQGQTLTLSQLTPYTTSPDKAVREAAWKARGGFFSANGEELDRLFHELVAVRHRMAKTLGHENYIPLGYDRMGRNSYGEADVDRFREGVRKFIVPLADKLKREQAERIGAAYPLVYSDNPLEYPTGNATPQGTPDDIMSHGLAMYREMSPETAEFMDFMMENELFDVLSRKGKAGGGYCMYLPDHKSPFIFANFNGTAGDVDVITHEAGHAFAAYQARDIFPLENQNPTMESCEIHSMSMEFFAWPWCEGFFGKDTQKYYFQHLASALVFLPYGTMVDHFQHEVYRNPGMTPAERHQCWAELEKVYRPWIRDEVTPFYREGRFWQQQAHIYERPFYYIDYCLAQTVALQFWAAIQDSRDSAWKRYLTLVSKAGTLAFDGLVASAGMASPFGENALAQVAGAAADWLDRFDRAALV